MLSRFTNPVRLINVIKWRICAEQGDSFAKFLDVFLLTHCDPPESYNGQYSQNNDDIGCAVFIAQTTPHHGENEDLKEAD